VSSPRVSVVIPVYNVGHYLEVALLSLAQQTFVQFEAIIVDDGSTDDSAEIAGRFVERDPRFRLVQKANGGLSSARNAGIAAARSPYIALLDGDDAYNLEKLASHVAILDADPKVGVVYSSSRLIGDSGKPSGLTMGGRPIYADPLLALLCKNFVGHGSNGIFRKDIVQAVGGFDESLRSSEDVDFWMRIAGDGRWTFQKVPQIQVFYRVRPTSLSFDVEQMRRSNEKVLEMALQRWPQRVAPMLPTARAYLYRLLARTCLQASNPVGANQYIRKALQSDASIFLKDIRSLCTLIAVAAAPLSERFLKRTLLSSTSS
jgi:glycosyltransferase involved in cell wall biosynthesis